MSSWHDRSKYVYPTSCSGDFPGVQGGLTKLEYFAAHAMQGLLSSTSDKRIRDSTASAALENKLSYQIIAGEAVIQANALIKILDELTKTNGEK